MGVRPPDNDDNDKPDVVAFGIATIDARLDETELTFPASAEAVLDALGRGDVPYDARGREMPLEVALDRCDRSEFEHRQELLNDLHEVFEKQRANSGGILSQLRALLPM